MFLLELLYIGDCGGGQLKEVGVYTFFGLISVDHTNSPLPTLFLKL